MRTLTSSPSISVYIDAGHESWHSSGTIAKRLRDVGIGRARGFALNVSNFYFTRDERAYGHRVSARVGGKPFVIDTSRNGRGPAPGRVWCNPPGRGLGQPATSDTGDSRRRLPLGQAPRRVRRHLPGWPSCREVVAFVRAGAGGARLVLASEDDFLGMVDHLTRLRRLDHHLDDLLDTGLTALPVALDRPVESYSVRRSSTSGPSMAQ